MTNVGDGAIRATTVRGVAKAYLAALPGSGIRLCAALDLVVGALGPDRALVDVDADEVEAVLTELEQRQGWPADGRQTVGAWLAWSRASNNGALSVPAVAAPTRWAHESEQGGYREVRWGRSGDARASDYRH